MTRLSRLVGIILHLQGRRLVRAEDIAEYFEVSVRTIYRDLRALEEAGLPLAAEAGKGYSLVDGYNLPPVMFTQEEASALLIGGRLAEHLGDKSLRPNVVSALMKINAVLPPERREFVERLRDATAVHLRRTFQEGDDKGNQTILQESLATRRVVRIAYRSGRYDERTERDVEPLAVVYYADYWHMIGWCRLREDVRDFRADRIEQVEVLEEEFSPRQDFDLKSHMRRFFEGGIGAEATVLFTRRAARHAGQRDYFGFTDEEECAEGVLMRFTIASYQWFAHWILSFGPDARVLEPPELVETVRRMAEEIAGLYRESDAPVAE